MKDQIRLVNRIETENYRIETKNLLILTFSLGTSVKVSFRSDFICLLIAYFKVNKSKYL